MRTITLYLALAGLGPFLISCNDDSGTDEIGECTPGTEACECIEGGLCVTGLVCASNLCVDFGADDTGDDNDDDGESGVKPDLGDDGNTGDGDGDGDTTSGDGDDGGTAGSCEGNCGAWDYDFDGYCWCTPGCDAEGNCCSDYESVCGGDCSYNSDCAASEVCSSESGSCVDAIGHTYTLTAFWNDGTPDCWDSGLESGCLADVYMDAIYGGSLLYSSPYYPDVTSTFFPGFNLTANGTDGLTLAFYDWDEFSDNDPLNAVCVGSGVCEALDATDLHAGVVVWDFLDNADASTQFYVSLYFTPW